MISAATVFPNLSMVHNWPRVEDSDDVLPFITLRTWQPVGPDETEVLSWFAVDASAPEEFKALSYKAYLMCFGSTGMFEQDDVENWVSLTSTAAGSMARRLLLNSRMGLLADGTPVSPRAGPGAVVRPGGVPRRLRRVRPAQPARPLGRLPRAPGRPPPRTASAPARRYRGERSPDAGGGAGMSAVTTRPATAARTRPSRRSARHASAIQRTGRTLPFGDERHLQAHQWLVDEAYLLDAQHYEDWLDLLADDIHYIMPVRVTTAARSRLRLGPGHGALRREQVLAQPPGRPLPDRARLDRGPAVPAAPPRHQRAHLRHRRPRPPGRRLRRAAVTAAGATCGRRR